MAVLLMDQKTLQIKVQLNINENFESTNDEKLKEIEKEATELRKQYNCFLQNTNKLLKKCTEWNQANNKKEEVKAKPENKEEVSKTVVT